ncbi:MAG: hypothetical protein QW258_00500 [Thermoplasmata archaeon]
MKRHPAMILFLFFAFLVMLDTIFMGEIFNLTTIFAEGFNFIYLIGIIVLSVFTVFTTYLLFEFIKKVETLRRSIRGGDIKQ